MLKNYFRIALRSLMRRRLYSSINIVGLSMGLTAAAIVVLYTKHEHSYDRFHTLSDKIYRISGERQGVWFAPLSAPYSNAISKGQFPETEKFARVRRWPPKFIKHGNDKFYEEKVLMTDPVSDFFTLFNFPFIHGNPHDALKDPYSVVLTASIAEKIFGSVNPVGKSLFYDTVPYTVTAVIKDLPDNTHFDFTMLLTNAKAMEEASGLFTYCIFNKGTNIAAFKNKLLKLAPAKKTATLENAAITPLTRLHFDSNMTYEMKPPGSRLYLLLLSLVGLLIVFLCCTNYMNLSIAMYAERKKEIAVRKVVGAGNTSLAIQFLTEAICIALICIPVTLALLQIMLPSFNHFMQVSLQNDFITTLPGFGLLLGITLIMGLIAGSYPAWVLPKLKAITLFHKINISGKGGLNLRKVLVTLQVSILVMIVSSSWIINNQIKYFTQKDLGFVKEGVLQLKGAWMVDSSQYYTLKNELLKNPEIKAVSQGFAPGDEDYGLEFRSPSSSTVYNDLISFGTDYDYTTTLGLDIIKSDFKKLTDEKPRRVVLINETLAHRLGYDDPVGKKIVLAPGDDEKAYTIDGVVKDFHFFSLHRPVSPMMFNVRNFGSGVYENILVKVQTAHLSQTVDFIKKQTSVIAPDIPITAKFLDDSLAAMYTKEQRLSTISRILLLVTLLLSMIGLIGLAAFMTGLRTKEVGVRKVLGAPVFAIVRLLSYSFIKMTLGAILIGSCLSLVVMNQWLKNFAYKTDIAWTVFAGTAFIMLTIVVVTICGHTLKAALANPIKSLRTE